jgi:hypothetical protein
MPGPVRCSPATSSRPGRALSTTTSWPGLRLVHRFGQSRAVPPAAGPGRAAALSQRRASGAADRRHRLRAGFQRQRPYPHARWPRVAGARAAHVVMPRRPPPIHSVTCQAGFERKREQGYAAVRHMSARRRQVGAPRFSADVVDLRGHPKVPPAHRFDDRAAGDGRGEQFAPRAACPVDYARNALGRAG